ncbi:MAG: esterase/lipase family protein [Arenimonas sp.]
MAEPVILLHGVWMRSPALLILSSRLRARGFAPIRFDYASLFRTPSKSMEKLAMKLYSFGAGPVHLVGHSLGGLMAVETLSRYQKLPTGRAVCLGSPLAGSATARVLHEKNLGFMTGRSGPLLRGGLVQVPDDREVGMIAGAKGRGLGQIVRKFDGLHDGTVAVWETRIPGLREHMVMPISHTGLVFSKEVAEHTANFLENGCFER